MSPGAPGAAVGGLADGRAADPQAGPGRRGGRVAAALAGGAGLVQAGVLPGRYRAGRLLGACDVGVPPATTLLAAGGPGQLRFLADALGGRPAGG